MKTAIISDIHGNYPALTAVIADARNNNADQFLFLGDYIFDLPFPNEVVTTISEMENSYVISGNKEVYLSELINENQDTWTYNQMGAVYQTYRELHKDVLSYLLKLPKDLMIPAGSDKSLYAIHYLEGIKNKNNKAECSSSGYHRKMREAPFTHEEYLRNFSKLLHEDEWAKEIQKVDADVIAIGHNHLQGYAYYDGKLIINPGSCGQPLDFDNRAPYTILDEENGKLTVIEKRVPYDVEKTICDIKKSKIYEQGQVWCQLCCLALRTGKDYFGFFFELANKIETAKSAKGKFFSNETWAEAYDIFAESEPLLMV